MDKQSLLSFVHRNLYDLYISLNCISKTLLDSNAFLCVCFFFQFRILSTKWKKREKNKKKRKRKHREDDHWSYLYRYVFLICTLLLTPFSFCLLLLFIRISFLLLFFSLLLFILCAISQPFPNHLQLQCSLFSFVCRFRALYGMVGEGIEFLLLFFLSFSFEWRRKSKYLNSSKHWNVFSMSFLFFIVSRTHQIHNIFFFLLLLLLLSIAIAFEKNIVHWKDGWTYTFTYFLLWNNDWLIAS